MRKTSDVFNNHVSRVIISKHCPANGDLHPKVKPSFLNIVTEKSYLSYAGLFAVPRGIRWSALKAWLTPS